MKRLMIVDDSSIMRRAIQKYLRGLDVEVVGTASNGRAAIELFRKTRPAIVTMDVTMPELDGLACLKELLSIDNDVAVVVITALSDPETGLKAVRNGARGFLNKPFTPEQLRAEIAPLLGGAS